MEMKWFQSVAHVLTIYIRAYCFLRIWTGVCKDVNAYVCSWMRKQKYIYMYVHTYAHVNVRASGALQTSAKTFVTEFWNYQDTKQREDDSKSREIKENQNEMNGIAQGTTAE